MLNSSIYLSVLTFLMVGISEAVVDNDYMMFTNEVAERLSERVRVLTNMYTASDVIQKEVDNHANGFTLNKRNGEKLNDDFKFGIENLFNAKANILYNIENKVQELKTQYKYDPTLSKYDFINVKHVNEGDNLTDIVPTFSGKVPVNMQKSFVQVPTNIYEMRTDILNTAKWTENMHETFVQNFDNHSDDSSLYQYYCDSTGLFRIYPGNKNGYDNSVTDLYDCRHRVWYIQASSSPKDVVIIIDTSGSMSGNNIAIAQITASSLIDTLQENDYFNIITVNEKMQYVSCIRYLLQATKKNKELMKLALKNMTEPTGVQNMDIGVKEAFKILYDSGSIYNRTSADCNKLIMIITDGVEGDYAAKDVFQLHNDKKSVHAFAYLVGSKGVQMGRALEKMACENNGKVYKVETLGNIWESVLEYVKVLGQPLNENKDRNLIAYTPIYLDSTGLGMIFTVALGIFYNNELTGVAGTDVAISSLKTIIPRDKVGVFSRNFVINNNGFVLLHPDLQDQSGYLPTPPNVLLEDLERSINQSHSETLKLSMLNHESGSMETVSYILYDNNNRISKGSTEYYYTPVRNSEFSSAVAVVDVDEYNYMVMNTTARHWLRAGLSALNPPSSVIYRNEKDETTNNTVYSVINSFISPWMYCNITAEAQIKTPKSIKAYPTLKEIYNEIKEVKNLEEIPPYCDIDLLKRLLTTSGMLDVSINKTWPSVISNYNKEIHALFVLSSGGFSKYYQTVNTTKTLDREVFNNGIYQQALLNPGASVILSSSTDNTVTLAGVIRQQIMDKKLLYAVSAVELNGNYMQEIFLNETKDDDRCSNRDNFVCLLVDDNGFIITSNQGEKYTGTFFSNLIGPLVEHLAHYSIFESVLIDDTQEECLEVEPEKSGACSLLSPVKFIFLALRGLFQLSYSFLFYICLWIVSFFGQTSYAVQPIPNVHVNVSCTRAMSFYTFNEFNWNTTKNKIQTRVQCTFNCFQNYSMSRVRNTNTIFIMANIPCEQCQMNGIKRQQLKQKLGDICDMKEEPRRKPLRYVGTPKNFTCHSMILKPSLDFVIVTLIIVFFLRKK